LAAELDSAAHDVHLLVRSAGHGLNRPIEGD
jgi:hypothetical protein